MWNELALNSCSRARRRRRRRLKAHKQTAPRTGLSRVSGSGSRQQTGGDRAAPRKAKSPCFFCLGFKAPPDPPTMKGIAHAKSPGCARRARHDRSAGLPCGPGQRLAALAAGFAPDATVEIAPGRDRSRWRASAAGAAASVADHSVPTCPNRSRSAKNHGRILLVRADAQKAFNAPLIAAGAEASRYYLIDLLHAVDGALVACGCDGTRLVRVRFPEASAGSRPGRLYRGQRSRLS